MGVGVLIYGRSGSGKSRSLKNFSEDEIFSISGPFSVLYQVRQLQYHQKRLKKDAIAHCSAR